MHTPHNFQRVRTLALVVLVSVMAGFLGHSAFAQSGPQQDPVGPSVASTIGTNFVSYQALRIVREDVAQTTSAAAFINLPGAVTTIVVPSGQQAIIMARYSAESACYHTVSTATGGWCSVRILANGTELQPVVGTDFAFDSPDGNRETALSWESHSMDRSRVVGPGTYTIQVQWGVVGSALEFRLDDSSLTIEVIRIS